MPEIALYCGYITASVAAVLGVVKAVKPLIAAVEGLFERTSQKCVQPLDDRVASLEMSVSNITRDIAPTNGDQRSISDRLDTVRYQTKCTNQNLEVLVNWLAKTLDTEPPPIHPIPDR